MTVTPQYKIESWRLRFLLGTKSGATPSSSVAEYWDGDIYWITPEDLGKLSGRELTDTRRKITEEGYLNSGVELAPAGSLVLSKRAPIGQTAIVRVESTCNQGCFLLTKKKGLDERFYYYALVHLRPFLEILGRGSTFMELSSDDLRSVRLPFPNSDIQKSIANYLDRETAHIDSLIAEKERMLALLEEKRAALISQAVTRGLDPDVPLKPSNALWFDLIPKHWKVERLKWVVDFISSGVSVNASDQPAENGAFGVLKTSAVAQGEFKPVENKSVWGTEYDRLACPVTAHSIIMSRMNTPALVGESGYVDQDYPNLFLPDRLWKITFDEQRVDVQFMALVLSSKEARNALSSMATGTSPSMKNLSQEEMMELLVPLPGLNEQREIRKYILASDDCMKMLQSELQNSVALLKERRAALITAAVTGQIPPEEMAA